MVHFRYHLFKQNVSTMLYLLYRLPNINILIVLNGKKKKIEQQTIEFEFSTWPHHLDKNKKCYNFKGLHGISWNMKT